MHEFSSCSIIKLEIRWRTHEDIVSILHVFSCRLYGLHKYKRQIERDEEIAEELYDGNKSDRGAESQNS